MISPETIANPKPNRSQRWLEIGFLVLVAVFTLGIFSHRFGIYHDDWVTVYILERLSFWHLLDLAQGQSRPMHAVLMALVGTTPLVSHAATFGVLVANMLFIRGLMRLIWPRIGVLATVIAALYAVYPGYWFRPISIALVTEASLTMALGSWVLAIYSVHWRGWLRYAAAAASMLLIPLYVLTYELPVGVEALRPLLFWALIPAATHRQRLVRALIHWWPWGLTLVAVVFYRLVIFEPTGFYGSINFNTVAAFDTLSTVRIFAPVFLIQIFGIWFNPKFAPAFVDPAGLIIGAILGTATFVLLNRHLRSASPIPHMLTGMLTVGLLIVVLGQATQIITMKPPLFAGWDSRWNQISMLGVVMIWSSSITILARGRLRQQIGVLIASALALLVAGGSIVHVNIGTYYVQEWQNFSGLWWQIAATGYQIDDGTSIVLNFTNTSMGPLAEFKPFPYEGLAAADLFFDNPSLAAVDFRRLSSLDAGDSLGVYAIDNEDWALRWQFDSTQTILLRMVDGCLQVVDPAHLDRYTLSEDVRAIAETLAPDPQQFFVEVPEGKTFPYRHLFGPPPTAEGCPSPFAIPGD